jgi:5-methylthioadenosine/S-adenosylhomocysteine deaminase
MKNVDMIVIAKHFYTMSGNGVGYKHDVAMIVNDSKIVDFLDINTFKKSFKSDKTIVLNHHAVFPGFIDAHMHTALCIARGLAQDTNNWMMHGLQPFDNVIQQKHREAGSKLGIIEGLKAGTTTFGDFELNMNGVCEFIKKIGVRGNIAQVIRSAERRVYKPGELYEYNNEKGEMSLQKNIELYEKWHNAANGRIKILLGPQGADFLSQELLIRIQKIAKEKKTKIHMHVQQGDRETYQIITRYNKRPIEWLDSIGYLDNNLIAVHLTDANNDEAKLVAKRGANMIVCPGSIGIIDGIVPPSLAFQEAGGNCALGSDQAPGNNCHNIINEMKNVALFNKIKYANPEVMPACKSLRMATIEGARAIGIGDIVGSLESGKVADFIAVDLCKTTMSPVFTSPMRNIVPNLVYSARGDEVDLSVINGCIIYQNGKIENLDEREIIDDANKYSNEIGEAAAKEFWAINGTNAKFMAEGML